MNFDSESDVSEIIMLYDYENKSDNLHDSLRSVSLNDFEKDMITGFDKYKCIQSEKDTLKNCCNEQRGGNDSEHSASSKTPEHKIENSIESVISEDCLKSEVKESVSKNVRPTTTDDKENKLVIKKTDEDKHHNVNLTTTDNKENKLALKKTDKDKHPFLKLATVIAEKGKFKNDMKTLPFKNRHNILQAATIAECKMNNQSNMTANKIVKMNTIPMRNKYNDFKSNTNTKCPTMEPEFPNPPLSIKKLTQPRSPRLMTGKRAESRGKFNRELKEKERIKKENELALQKAKEIEEKKATIERRKRLVHVPVPYTMSKPRN